MPHRALAIVATCVVMGIPAAPAPEWYAPALGRAVRLERISEWRDIGMCGRGVRCEMRGDWDLFELIEARAAKR